MGANKLKTLMKKKKKKKKFQKKSKKKIFVLENLYCNGKRREVERECT